MHVDIKCVKCGTEYELESEKMPAAGLTVKCTTCGFIFKAMRPEEPVKKTMLMYASPVAAEPVPAAPPPPTWLIRRPDGTQFGFNDLAALQRLVAERSVAETDEISRQGEGWRKIGEIPEFAGFFIVRSVVSSAPVSAPPAPAPQPPFPPAVPSYAAPSTAEIIAPTVAAPPPYAPVTVPPAPVAAPPVAPAPIPVVAPPPMPEPVPVMAPAVPVSVAPPPALSKGPSTIPIGVGRPAPADDDRILNAIPHAAPAAAPQPVTAPKQAAPHHDEKHAAAEAHFHRELTADDYEKLDVYGRPKKPVGLIIGIIAGVVLLLVGGSVALRFVAPATFASIFGTEPALTKAQEAELADALKSADINDVSGWSAAVGKLAKFKPADKDEGAKFNPTAVAAIAMTKMAWGEPLRDEALDMKAVLDDMLIKDPTNASAEAKALNDAWSAKMDEGIKQINEGFELARKVVKQSPESMLANVVLADYYRIQSANEPQATPKMKQYLDDAEKDKGAKDSPYFLLVKGGGALRADPASEDGMKTIKRALELNPTLMRAHYIVARAHLVGKKPAEAKAALEAMLAGSPGNTVAQSLLVTVNKALAPAAEKKEEPGAVAPKEAAKEAGKPVEKPAEKPVEKEEPAEAPAAAAKEKKAAEPRPEAKPETKKEKAAKAEGEEPAAPKGGGNYEASIKQARRLRESGKTKQALESFQKAADADPTKADPHSGLGWCHVEMEKFDLAIAEFKKALGLKGPKCEALSGLGESYKYKKNKQEAINYYQKYLQECPNGPDAPVARNAINSMR